MRAIAEPESGIAGRRQTRACRQRRVERLLSRHSPTNLRRTRTRCPRWYRKAHPGKAGVDNLQAEIEKLTRIRAIWVGTEPFANVPRKVLQMLKRRASKETRFLGNTISSGVAAPTSFRKGSDGHLVSTYIFQLGLGSALPRTTISHLNARPIEGVKWSTIQVQKSTIYLQFGLHLNRRPRGKHAHFWSTIRAFPSSHSAL